MRTSPLPDGSAMPESRGLVFVLDDEPDIVEALTEVLEDEGYACRSAQDPLTALAHLEQEEPDAVLLDLRLPQMDGREVFQRIRRRYPDLPVIIITAHGDIPTAVEFIRQGAFEFLEKPLHRERVLTAVRNAVEQYRLKRTQAWLQHWAAPPRLLGHSPAIERLREEIERAARTDATVLIVGESGSGKELVAWEIHHRSPRRNRPFVRVNCAAIPRELIESELFGHKKGAFTGAVSDYRGKFEQADGGSIFLDEIGDMSLEAQAKVLRVLETGEIEPIGAGQSRFVHVRVIAATNQDLAARIRQGLFREDLYYRLTVLVIRVPPLREHREDIPELVEWFSEQYARRNGLPAVRWSPEALERLKAYPWPGNVRELRNFVEYCLTLHSRPEITGPDVEAYLADIRRRVGGSRPEVPAVRPGGIPVEPEGPLHALIERVEKWYIQRVLEQTGGNVAEAARRLRVPRSNLYKKMEKYDIRIRKDVE